MKVSYGYLVHLIFFIHVRIIKSEVKQAHIQNAPEPHRIAIIGAGIGGSATAHFLHELTGGHALIDVYESGHVGGRLATSSIAGGYYETGGTILHPTNEYMKQFVQELGLSSTTADCVSSAGLFDGTEFVFRESSWQSITLAKLLWRYGWGVYSLHSHNEDLLQKFANIYSLQQNGTAYRTTMALLHAIHPSFPALTQTSTRHYLREKLGLSEEIVAELVTAASLANYGQTTDNMHAFVGAISVAAASPSLWRVAGGNRQVPELLMSRSRATLLRRHATQVAVTGKDERGRDVYQVSSVETDNSNSGLPDLYTEGGYPLYRPSQQQEQQKDKNANVEGAEDVRIQEYDAVIVATPLTADKSNLKFINTTRKLSFPGNFERIVTTLVEGKLRNAVFKLPETDRVDEILVVNPELVYNAIGLLTAVEDDQCNKDRPMVYKVFSPRSLSPEQLQLFFAEVKSTRVIDWRAFPHYEPRLADYPSFELQPGLYHLNAIEWLGSAIEMSAIAAKNVALLALKHLTGDSSAGSAHLPKDEL